MGLGTALGLLLLPLILVGPRIERGPSYEPWTEPAPEYAVHEGYADYRDQGAGWAVEGWAEWRIAQEPPRGDGPLVIDRVHSAKQPHDSYLTPGTYSYSRMFGLGRAFDPVRDAGVTLQVERDRISPGVLAGASALFINLPSGTMAPFLHDEVQAIDAFVRAGGGLVLITDHTNCYFHAEQLLPLSSVLGVQLPPVTACDVPPNTLSPATRSWLRVSGVGEHPVTRGVEVTAVATAGEVLGPPEWSWLLRTSERGWADGWEPYLKPASAGFTGDLRRDGPEGARPVVIALAGTHGLGRVVVLGDQNAWGEALVGVEDNSRLFANAVGWVIGRDIPVRVREQGSVTTLTGPRSLCTAPLPEAFRTLQVQLMRLARHHLVPEFCTQTGQVQSERLVVLPEVEREDLPSLVQGAERVLVVVDEALAERLGLVLGERVETRGLETELPRPFPDHAVWSAEVEPLVVRAWSLEGEVDEVLASSEGRPVLVRRGNLLLLLDPDLVRNEALGKEREPPWKEPLRAAHHQFAFQVLGRLFD